MDHARGATVRPLLAVLAVAFGAAAIWAATALAGSSGNAGPAGGNDAPALVQIQGGNGGSARRLPRAGQRRHGEHVLGRLAQGAAASRPPPVVQLGVDTSACAPATRTAFESVAMS